MFSQSADKPAADDTSAPIGMRELPPQPAKPVMPTYGTATPTAAEPATEIAPAGPFWRAEDYHQQYLAKNPSGYCGLGGTGVTCPSTGTPRIGA